MPDEFGWQLHGTDKFQECLFRVSRGENSVCRDLFTAGQYDAFCYLALNTDTSDFRLTSDFTAKGSHSVCQSSCDFPCLPHVDMRQTTSIHPVVNQGITRPCGHGTQCRAVDGNRGYRSFHNL